MQWDNSIQSVTKEYDGRFYGRKSSSFTPYASLPKISEARLELAVGGAGVPREWLRDMGWSIEDPIRVARDTLAYQSYIQQSLGEFSIAKQAYVDNNCGWFSERSACYLASGRPVLVQETGFSEWLDTGMGVVTFSSIDEAVAGTVDIINHYEVQCRYARKLAEEYFDSRQVLTELIERALQVSSASNGDVVESKMHSGRN
jgi:hypothetical protein